MITAVADPTVTKPSQLYHFRIEMNQGTNWFGVGLGANPDDGMTGADMWVVYQNAGGDMVIDDRNGNQGQAFTPLDKQQVRNNCFSKCTNGFSFCINFLMLNQYSSAFIFLRVTQYHQDLMSAAVFPNAAGTGLVASFSRWANTMDTEMGADQTITGEQHFFSGSHCICQ